jgi:hypothetical protein
LQTFFQGEKLPGAIFNVAPRLALVVTRKGRDKKSPGPVIPPKSDSPQGGGQGWHATKTPGAFGRASPVGEKHMDVLNIKKGGHLTAYPNHSRERNGETLASKPRRIGTLPLSPSPARRAIAPWS